MKLFFHFSRYFHFQSLKIWKILFHFLNSKTTKYTFKTVVHLKKNNCTVRFIPEQIKIYIVPNFFDSFGNYHSLLYYSKTDRLKTLTTYL